MQVGKQACVTSFIAIFILLCDLELNLQYLPGIPVEWKKIFITDKLLGDQGQILQEWRWVKEKHMLLLSADLYTICTYSLSDQEGSSGQERGIPWKCNPIT